VELGRVEAGEEGGRRVLAGELAAVDDEGLAGDIGGGFAGEEEERGSDVFDAAGAAERDVAVDEVADEFGGIDFLRHGRLDVAGADGVHADAEVRELEGHGAGEHEDAALGGVVVGVAGFAVDGVFAAHVEDDAAAAGGHEAGGGLGDEEEAGEVDVEDLAPLAFRDVEKTGFAGDAGVVDEDVEWGRGHRRRRWRGRRRHGARRRRVLKRRIRRAG